MTNSSHPTRKSPRWKEFDYSSATGYFLTLCTHNRECLLGTVQAGEIVLSTSGHIVRECWQALPEHFPTLVLDEFVVMPNHLHAIVFLLTADQVALERGIDLGKAATTMPPVSLTEVIRYYWTTSAKRINRLRMDTGSPVWQRSFYDHVIRRSDTIDAIRSYILRNPGNWEYDTEAPDGRGTRAGCGRP